MQFINIKDYNPSLGPLTDVEDASFYIPLFESRDSFRAKIKSLIDDGKC